MEISHPVQIGILKQLLFTPKARFTDLNKFDMTSDQFTYHLKKLIRDRFIEKENDRYILSRKGRTIAYLINKSNLIFALQPKTGVLIFIEKLINSEKYILLGRRKKQPQFGKIGFYAGKIIQGTSYLEIIRTHIKEETNLDVESYKFKGIVRIIDKRTLDDRIMFYCQATLYSGLLNSDTIYAANKWYREKDLKNNNRFCKDFMKDLQLFRSKKTFFLSR